MRARESAESKSKKCVSDYRYNAVRLRKKAGLRRRCVCAFLERLGC